MGLVVLRPREAKPIVLIALVVLLDRHQAAAGCAVEVFRVEALGAPLEAEHLQEAPHSAHHALGLGLVVVPILLGGQYQPVHHRGVVTPLNADEAGNHRPTTGLGRPLLLVHDPEIVIALGGNLLLGDIREGKFDQTHFFILQV